MGGNKKLRVLGGMVKYQKETWLYTLRVEPVLAPPSLLAHNGNLPNLRLAALYWNASLAPLISLRTGTGASSTSGFVSRFFFWRNMNRRWNRS